jgi:hypothetical protein
MRWMLKKSIWIQRGLESREPEVAADRYIQALRASGRDISGQSVLVLGYGGFFGLGISLLLKGARHVTLCDPYAKLDNSANRALVDSTFPYLQIADRKVITNPDWITLIHEDILSVAPDFKHSFDLVFSSSVYEHLDDVESITAALAYVSRPECFHLHFIDLRDHYFKYPFEMLCYSERAWRTFLNPKSNLNRLRVWHYESAFRKNFRNVRWESLDSDLEAFRNKKNRIRSEFRSGENQLDAVTRILMHVSEPLSKPTET